MMIRWKSGLSSFKIFCVLLMLLFEVVSSQNERSTLLKLARERSLNAKTNIDFQKIQQIYEKLIEFSDGKLLGKSLFELSQLLLNQSYSFSASLTDPNHIFELLVQSAELGHPQAQVHIGAAYATGVDLTLVPMHASSSILLQYMAALSGRPEGHMAMGHRYLHGLGVPESCEAALPHYEYAANRAAEEVERRGFSLFIDHTRLSDTHRLNTRNRQDFDPEMMDFYLRLAEEGDMQAAITASSVYATGSRRIPQNTALADKYLNLAATGDLPSARGQVGYNMALSLGKALSRKLPLNSTLVDIMKKHLQYAYNRGDPAATIGMGYMHMRGIGVPRNLSRAMEFLVKAQGKHADSGWHLGNLLMGQAALDGPLSEEESGRIQVDTPAAGQFYMQSSQLGNLLSLHRLSHMMARGIGMPRSCGGAIGGFKQVAEAGTPVVALNTAHALYDAGHIDRALAIFAQIASLGVESAQYNTAYILTRRYCPPVIQLSPKFQTRNISIETPFIIPTSHSISNSDDDIQSQTKEDESVTIETSSNIIENNLTRKQECEIRALYMYMVSAKQGHADSYLRVGDFHYYGQAGLLVRKREAAVYYQMAADLRNTHAIFNLGLMHETGDGVEQDFHLAKRFYDQAASFDADARLPRAVALALLEGHRSLRMLVGPEMTAQVVNYTMYAWQYILSVVAEIKDRVEGISVTVSMPRIPPAERKALAEIIELVESYFDRSTVFWKKLVFSIVDINKWLLNGAAEAILMLNSNKKSGSRNRIKISTISGAPMTDREQQILIIITLLILSITAWISIFMIRFIYLRRRRRIARRV